MRKPAFAYAKTKTQISFAVTAKLISAFVFATRIVQSLYSLNPKIQAPRAIFCGCTARFVSDLVGNPEDRFSQNEALFTQIIRETPFAVLFERADADKDEFLSAAEFGHFFSSFDVNRMLKTL